jgi:hypothetical protein
MIKNQMVSLRTDQNYRGDVLLAYVLDPFLLKDNKQIPTSHTHFWESVLIAEAYLSRGFNVDVISYLNAAFIPQKKYSLFVSARSKFQAIADRLNSDCIKIVHLDTSHWLYNNTVALNRYLELQRRRNITVPPKKIIKENWAIENADYATILGNDFTASTYAFAGKQLFKLPVPTVKEYNSPENRDIAATVNNFIWLGSAGIVNKGLDLTLEAFAGMPNVNLFVCGPVDDEKAFVHAYHKELYKTENINTIGWIDVAGDDFKRLISKCCGLVYPSCAEGQAGAVVTCMQAGLIPIISRQSGVDVEGFGIILKENSVTAIMEAVKSIQTEKQENIRQMALNAWNYARKHHTRERYSELYGKFVDELLDRLHFLK